MGMTYEEYWRGDPYLTVIYRKAWELRKEQRNHELWWQGFYIYEAVGSVMSSIFHAKGKKPDPYPSEPHRITPLTEKEKAEKKASVHNQLATYFLAKQEAFNEKHGEQH